MNIFNSKSLAVLLFACLIASFFTLVYSTNIHSDILFMKYLLDDLTSGGRWSDWRLSPAPSYFPDMIFYGLAYAATSLVPLQIILTTVMQVLVIGSLSAWLVRKVDRGNSGAAQLIPLALLLLCIITTAHYGEDAGIGIFFGSNNIQVPTLISSLILLGLTLSIFEKNTPTKSILLIGIGALGYASSAIFLICFTAPFILTITILHFHYRHKQAPVLQRATATLLTLFLSSQAAGYLLSKTLTYNSPLNGRIPLSLEGAKNSALKLWEATCFLFAPSTPWAFLTAVVFLSGLIYAISRCTSEIIAIFSSGKNTNKNSLQPTTQELLLGTFLLTSTATSIFGAILSGGFIDKFGYRYFESFIALSAILSIHHLNKQLPNQTKKPIMLCIAGFMIINTLLSTYTLVFNQTNKPLSDLLRNGAYNGETQTTANCLDNLIQNGIPLKAGVADYWMSRGVMFYMNNKKYISQSSDSLRPFFWISSIAPIKQPELYDASTYNFVIADDGKYGKLMGFDYSSLSKKLPPEYNSFTCPNTSISILYYSTDALNSLVKNQNEKFLFSELGYGSATFTGAELPGLIGKNNGSSKEATESDGKGILAFGPYISLPNGTYVATLEFDSSTAIGSSPGQIEIGRFDTTKQTILYNGEIPADRKSMEMKFSIPGKGLERIEAHIVFNGQGSLTIHKLRFLGEQ
jgi:hypothetical protein